MGLYTKKLLEGIINYKEIEKKRDCYIDKSFVLENYYDINEVIKFDFSCIDTNNTIYNFSIV